VSSITIPSPQNMKASKDRTEQFMYTSSGPASAMASSNRASSASSPLDTGVAGPRLRRANGPPSNPYADAHLARPESILNAPPPNRGGSPYAPSPVGGSTGGRNSTDGGYSVDRKGKGRGDYLALDLEDAEGGRGGAGGGGAQGMQMQMMEEQVRTRESDSGQSRASLTPVIKTVPTPPPPAFLRTTTSSRARPRSRRSSRRSPSSGPSSRNLRTWWPSSARRSSASTPTRPTSKSASSFKPPSSASADQPLHRPASSNVQGAQRELLKYYASVSSNRWLMLKIFGVLIIFFLLFILVT